MLNRLCSTVYQILPRLISPGQLGSPAVTNLWSLTLNRTSMRYHFPRPNERRRIKRHGWYARMATPSGRRILMRRILKGRHVLSH
ncbi:mitochondrial ribosomal protein L34 [Megalopta genalis]|uniref:mitochondrial ribosomal protein L34 n=1 Tax=Megalopta genalis TaxID=115081 RepID=UPI001442E797|nr:39S ribosomal protein L34, mitochondrial [Megalopta genalis]XP_033323025.1 39S ribosomal protein L34, mitochondrial [Megalopta genalis]